MSKSYRKNIPDKFCYKLDSRKIFWIYKTRNNIKWYREYKARDQPNIRTKFIKDLYGMIKLLKDLLKNILIKNFAIQLNIKTHIFDLSTYKK